MDLNNNIPWIEKYRPNNFNDILLDEHIYKILQSNNNLILTGTPGVGKTSSARCIAKDYETLEINAADDRSAKLIEDTINLFCKKISEKKKIIILDEFDNMISSYQYIIKNLMDKYNVKFILICNEQNKVIEILQSNCLIIKFNPLKDEQIKSYLIRILNNEKIPFEENGLNTICYYAGGDMRKAINNLQLVSYAHKKITKKNFIKICKVPDLDDIILILDLCKKNKFDESIIELNKIINKGYYLLDIISSFELLLKIKKDIKLLKILNETKYIITSGIYSKLQLYAMIARFAN